MARMSPFTQRWLLTIACWMQLTAVLPAARYAIRPLELVDGQVDVYAQGVNNRQEVVGYVIDSEGSKQAAVWRDHSVTLLPSLGDDLSTWAFRINEQGQVVGKASTAEGRLHAVMWDANGIRDIGTLPGGQNSFAADINERGVVAGSSEGEVGSYAFTWTAEGGFVPVASTDPPLRLTVAGFNGINDNGLAVGTTYYLLEPFRAAYANPGDKLVTDLSPPGRTVGMAMAVNNQGTIVGYQSNPNEAPQAAIFSTSGSFQQLGTLGLDESWALDVNDAGTIVGRAFSFGPGGELIPRAFVYEQGQMEDLLRISEGSEGWEKLIEATSISNTGVIVGEGIMNGQVRAFLAVPVPEPATNASLLLAALAFRRRTAKR